MYPPSKTTFIIADDHDLYRVGFKTLLEGERVVNYHIVAEAGNGVDLIKQVEKYRPDVVITDIKMPEMDGINACIIIKEKYPLVAVIALTLYEDAHVIYKMMNAGASGYLLKINAADEILACIKKVVDGKEYYSSKIEEKMIHYCRNKNNIKKAKFSSTEIKIIQLLCGQLTNKEIAKATNFHVRTIEDYRRKIQEKMDVKNAVGIALYAAEHGIIDFNELLTIKPSLQN